MKALVEKSHYEFSRYVTKKRWASMWHQIDEVLALAPENVLEIGPGPGIFKSLLTALGTRVETLDLDAALEPDHIASADNMPFKDDQFDVVCAFQMLEHVPYKKSLEIFSEMNRVAKKAVVISLPDSAKTWPMSVHIPRLGTRWFHLPRPSLGPKKHEFDGQHYWEINKKDYPLERISKDLASVSCFDRSKTFRVPENPYHRFFVFSN